MLLGPLHRRGIGHDYAQEDIVFVEALCRALEEDISQGRLPDPISHEWLYCAAERLTPPVLDQEDFGFAPVKWPAPGEPWGTPENADPREYLLARLIHLGADPFEKIIVLRKEVGSALAGNVAGALLSRGYCSVFSMCMDLPGFAAEDAEHKCPNIKTGTADLTYLKAAVAQDDWQIVKRLLDEKSPQKENILFEARSPEMVGHLLSEGANPSDIYCNKTLQSYWLEERDARTARLLLAAVETRIDPTSRVQAALGGSAWSPVKDALNAFPEWKEATVKVGGASIRLPLWTLMSDQPHQKLHKIHNALRIAETCPFDDREVCPGLSEATLARLTLKRLLQGNAFRGKAGDKVKDALKDALFKINQEHPPSEGNTDVQKFILSSKPLWHTPEARLLAEHFAEKSQILPSGDRFSMHGPTPGWDAFNLLSSAAGMINNLQNEGFKHLFGYDKIFDFIARIRPSDHRKTWLDKIIKDHPGRRDEIVSGLSRILMLQIRSGVGYGNFQSQNNYWGDSVRRIEGLLQEGAALDLTPSEMKAFGGISKKEAGYQQHALLGGWDEVRRLSASIESYVNKHSLDQSTQQVASQRVPRRRF